MKKKLGETYDFSNLIKLYTFIESKKKDKEKLNHSQKKLLLKG